MIWGGALQEGFKYFTKKDEPKPPPPPKIDKSMQRQLDKDIKRVKKSKRRHHHRRRGSTSSSSSSTSSTSSGSYTSDSDLEEFVMTHTPGMYCGKHLPGSGQHQWPGNIQKAAEKVIDLGYGLGAHGGVKGRVRVIQEAKGKLYFYDVGFSGGKGGPNCWTSSLSHEEYVMTKTPHDECYQHVPGSGRAWAWNGIGNAIEYLEDKGYRMGKDITQIQNKDGKLFYYCPGKSNGKGCSEIWRFDRT